MTDLRRIASFLAGSLLMSCVAACAGAAGGVAAPPPQASPSPQTPVSTPEIPTRSFVPMISPEHLTAACPLIGGEEIRAVLKQGVDFTYQPNEIPRAEYDGVPVYECKYIGMVTRSPAFDLAISVVTGNREPMAALQTAEKDCRDTPKPIPGAGQAAMFCSVTDETTAIATVKHSHNETRSAILFISYPASARNYPDVAKLLADRL